ncbi:transcriptional regulator BetI [Pistricoccus aurantiacus]|uniref:HTH-type transcriptional regulator BetI n=1 Tax=Pistricoccus aurantiacus TaxID=1883414 RepID=A0A5B8SVP7_9GAMM|nr:transcriptional regulator BetI [Pistricoccus aurantiacus]QEA39615.1 transcriptional regulator BetI [Pistricoccus aurantiacus]
MPKLGMEPIRRHQLVKATIQAIDEAGLANATIARIAKSANVSTGIISHYFGGKEGLLEATMRQVLADLGNGVAKRRAVAGTTPRAQIRAIIDGNFDRDQISQSVMKTWLDFWASSMHRQNLQRLQRVNDRRLYSNLCFQFRRYLPKQEARDAAHGLAALIDGLWLRGALAVEAFDVERAQRLAYDYLEGWLKDDAFCHFSSPTPPSFR